MGVHNIKTKAEFDSASAEPSVFVVDFMATWCGPCKVVAPKIVEMSEKYPAVRFFKLDVDEVPDVSAEMGVRAMPTFMVFKDGEKVAEVVGATLKPLEMAIEKAIDTSETA